MVRVKVKVKAKTGEKEKKKEVENEKSKAKKRSKAIEKEVIAAEPKVLLRNALFANAGLARHLVFVIDISGSMSQSENSFGGKSRIEVVKKYLKSAVQSMEGAADASFGVVLFDGSKHLPLGASLLSTDAGDISRGLAAIAEVKANGGNGGEPAALGAALSMRPEAIFFLGDGGWDTEPVIAAAQRAAQQGAAIHSIAFFAHGGGMVEAAKITNGSFRRISGPGDLAQDVVEEQSEPAKPAAPEAYNDGEGSDRSDEEDEDDEEAEDESDAESTQDADESLDADDTEDSASESGESAADDDSDSDDGSNLASSGSDADESDDETGRQHVKPEQRMC